MRYFRDKNGKPFLMLGVQAHNSSTGTWMMDKTIQVARLYGANTIEAPVYWNWVEPEEGKYDLTSVKRLIEQVRAAGLKLIILWFATSKNGHPNYAPDYVKTTPDRYPYAKGPDGVSVASLSPHGVETMKADARAYGEMMKFIRDFDGDEGTVIAMQIENEMGLANTDMDYGSAAREDYKKPVPEILRGIVLEDAGPVTGEPTWPGIFGRHAHEAFCAYYHAAYLEHIARTGKEIYPIPTLTNVMVGEQGDEEPGLNYNSGSAAGRVLDIYKAAAPHLDYLCPDIYNAPFSEYERIAARYTRPDNPLMVPESSGQGEANAVNMVRAFTKFKAIGVACFGAESFADSQGNLKPGARPVALSMRMMGNIAPLLIRNIDKGNVYCFLQEEFQSQQYLRLEKYHVLASFIRSGGTARGLGSAIDLRGNPENDHVLKERGRAVLIQTGEHEFYLCGAGVTVNFRKRPDALDEDRYAKLTSRMATNLNHLHVEEGHFDDNGDFVVDYVRNGDETNYDVYVHEGQVVRLRLNPVF